MRARGRSFARTAIASLRWLLAGTLVATAHGTAVWLAVEWQPHEAAASEPPPAMMIELAPLAVTPDIVPIQSVASADSAPEEPQETPEQVEPEKPAPEPLPPPEPVKQPEPVKLPEPAKPVEPAPAKPPEPAPPPVEPAIKTPEAATPDPLPAEPKPSPPEEAPPEPPQVEPKKSEPPKAETPKTEPVRKVETAQPKKPAERKVAAKPKSLAAPRSADAKAAKASKSAAPVSGAGQTSVSPASWKSRLLAHLNRHKRFPRGAGAGTASVAFSIDRQGRVLSARLANSSGDAKLDDEAVSLVRRASPVPVPPDGFGGGRIALTVPVRFSR